MISNSLMNSANKMRPGAVRKFEAELSVAVGLGAGSHIHAVGDVDENNFIARGGFAGGAVGHGTGEGLGSARGEGQREDGGQQCGLCEFGQINSLN
jgi:hypothetical protein